MMNIHSELNPDMSNRVESESIQPTSSASRWSSQNALVREWWDPEKRAKYSRPGPCLPPLAAYEKFHNANHTLLKVRITAPRDEDVADCRIGTVISLQDGFVIPSDTEVQSAIPHSSAAYCLEENGWIILEIRASKTLPKFSRLAASAVLPDEVRRQRNTTCRAPETHHLRQYDNAADGSILDIPYSPTKWTAKHSNLMNVFICSRCATYAVVSAEIIPGVIPVAILDAYIKERSDKPQAGYSPQSMVARALRSVLRIIENYLWKGEYRSIKSTCRFFTYRIGWSEQSKQLWAALGFTYKLLRITPELAEHEIVIPPAPTSEVRARLLRGWVELHAWLANYKWKSGPLQFGRMKDRLENQYMEFVKVEAQTETTQMLLGHGMSEMNESVPLSRPSC